MKTRTPTASLLIFCASLAAAAFLLTTSAVAATITVNSTADGAANDGQCTLGEAITSANTNTASGAMAGECGAGSAGLDTIAFNIPGSGVRTITLTSALPTITEPIVIDGYKQPGSSANTLAVGDSSVHLVELNGNSAVCGALVITAGNSTVRGLVINRFNGNCANTAVLLQTGGSNKVEGCFLGLNASGTAASTNRGDGVRIENSANNLIGGTTAAARNVIAGNNTQIFISGNSSFGTTIQGNYIGTNAAGDAPLSNGGTSQSVTGVSINTNLETIGPANTTIGGTTAGARNVIAGNISANISFLGSTSTGNVIEGNYIGINAAGTAAVGLSGTGIDLTYSSNFTIGGVSAGAGNVISGNSAGIYITGNSNFPATNNLIQGNLIGTNAAGTAAVGNSNGIVINTGAPNNTIGGVIDGARNLVSGNENRGIVIHDSANTVQGNFIGTDITGTAKIGNVGGGIVVGGLYGLKTSGMKIGGTTAPARNVISGNGGDGINLFEGATLVQGNYIGTDVNGTGNLGNGLSGISINGDNNTIGGTGAGNLIAFNGAAGPNNGDGVVVSGSTTDGVLSGVNNAILGNSIFANGRLGISLYGGSGIDNAAGVTANDSGDPDEGGNHLQNYPVLRSVTITSGNVNVVGTLNSIANSTYRLEFFGNDVVDPSGFGEGRYFLGFTNVTTDNSGNASFDVNLADGLGSRHVTSTATDSSGNTSEFSAAVGQLQNISTRLRVQTGDNVLIAGFIVNGTDPKRVIVRGLGPSLSAAGIGDPLLDPTLELHDGSGALLLANDNWKDTQQAEIEATTIPPKDDRESAIVDTLPANNSAYTAVVRGKNNTTGTAVVEVYDLNPEANSTLANISTRGFVGTGNNVLIGGFIVGNGASHVIVRALGPSLGSFGVASPLADPTLEVHDGFGALVAKNDNWRNDQEAEIIATQVPPPNDLDSAIVATLAPGPYTAVVRGVNDVTGVGLVEVYTIK